MATQRIDLGYRPRPQFVPFHARRQRWACIVAHRRAGKTVACIADLVDAALRSDKPNPRFAYIAPLFVQAKDVAWAYLKQFTASVPGVGFNEAELRVDLPGGGRVRLYGAENYDRLRGLYLDGVVLDEAADFPQPAWSQVIRPALSDRKGWATFIGTPKGRNQFWTIYDTATRDPDWFTLMLRASETGILDAEELAAARKGMEEDAYLQEYEGSFDAAVLGSYYGKLLDEAQAAGRISRVPYDPALKVETWWDLGVNDATVVWFAQRLRHAREVRVIDFLQASGEGLPYYVRVLQQKPYVYGRHIAPHDLAVREWGTGKSRVEVAAELGLKFEIAPNMGLPEGIDAVRRMLPLCWFDAEKTAAGLESLRLYRRDFDERLNVFRDRPRHDQHSHPADAFRTGAVALEPAPEVQLPRVPSFVGKHAFMA